MIKIPNDWHRVSLQQIARIQTGLAKGDKNINDPVRLPYLRVANVQDGYLDLTEIKEIEVERSKVNQYLLQKHDILLTEGGDFDKLGRGTIWNGEISPCVHQNHVFAVRLNQEIILPYFFAQQASSPYGKQYFLSIAKRTTNLASINKAQLSEFPVLLPPLPEQRKIAAILSTWDEAITLVEALIAALKTRKQGLMQRLLTGEVRFPGFDGEWIEQSIGSMLEEVQRRVDPESDKEYKLLSVRRRSEGAFFRETRKGSELNETMYKVKENDFLISKRQIVHGASALATAEFDGFIVSNAYHTLQPKNGNSIRFFKWLSKTPYLYHLSYISSHGVHIEKLFFVIESYLKHRLHTPTSFEEQERIADMLDSVEDLIQGLQLYRNTLHEQKKGLMQRLLTGEVRVEV